MSATETAVRPEQSQIERVASRLARSTNPVGAGMGKQHLVRLNESVFALLMAAKPEGQSMALYLKESALLRALQSLEDSQK